MGRKKKYDDPQIFNFFIPSAKTVSKERIDSKIIKIFDFPKMPFERLMTCDDIPKQTKKELTKIFKDLNPFKVQNAIRYKIKKILSLL